jgi:hypothetical protein
LFLLVALYIASTSVSITDSNIYLISLIAFKAFSNSINSLLPFGKVFSIPSVMPCFNFFLISEVLSRLLSLDKVLLLKNE